MYRFYNANPYKRKINDCSIRSISLATGKSWNDTYKELAREARQMGLMMDSIEFLEEYLDKRYKRTCYSNITMREFIDNVPRGTYVVSMPGHLSCVINKNGQAINYDTFNPESRYIWCSWKIV